MSSKKKILAKQITKLAIPKAHSASSSDYESSHSNSQEEEEKKQNSQNNVDSDN